MSQLKSTTRSARGIDRGPVCSTCAKECFESIHVFLFILIGTKSTSFRYRSICFRSRRCEGAVTFKQFGPILAAQSFATMMAELPNAVDDVMCQLSCVLRCAVALAFGQ